MLIPTTLDQYVRHSRDLIRKMRGDFSDQQDFERWIRQGLVETLEAYGYDRKAIAFTVRAIFADD